ncbi:MAG TPA: hypothetical protein VFT22_32195, partial [Kofleriaceae bacterium]|nr:hypothetical protein [Kofleriaceae bacterium]
MRDPACFVGAAAGTGVVARSTAGVRAVRRVGLGGVMRIRAGLLRVSAGLLRVIARLPEVSAGLLRVSAGLPGVSAGLL